VVDALSRVGSIMSIQTVSVVQPLWMQKVLNSYVIDAFAQQLLQQLAIHSPNEEGYSVQ
jgi:hypothetical protein